MAKANLKTYPDAVPEVLKQRGENDKVESWLKQAMILGHVQAKALAKSDFNVEIFWCMEAPRAREGYYRIKVLHSLRIHCEIKRVSHMPVLWTTEQKYKNNMFNLPALSCLCVNLIL